MQRDQELYFKYTFDFGKGEIKIFEIQLEKNTLWQKGERPAEYPDWALLKNFRCPNCPLEPSANKYCPLAQNLSILIPEFFNLPSYEEVFVTVETPNRTYFKKTSLQAGVSSLLGIYMVSSGCPVMGKLKPMLYFHLPFASLDETQIKALSMFLLGQYVRWKKGEAADWDMLKLIDIYEDIRILNMHVCQKIANLEKKDTSINSLVILNNFADYVTFTIDENLIEEIEFYTKWFYH